MSELDQELQDVFRAELAAALDGLAAQLELLADRAGDPRPVCRDAMRIAHNVKGAARVVGFHAVAELAHALEDVLGAVADEPLRGAELELAEPLAQVVSKLESFADGNAEDDVAELCAEVRGLVPWLDGGGSSGARSPDSRSLDDTAVRPAPQGPAEAAAADPDTASASAPPSAADGDAAGDTMRVHVNRLDRLMATTGELLTAQEHLVPRAHQLDALRDELTVFGRQLDGDAGVRVRSLARRLDELCRVDREELRRMSYLADGTRDAMRRVRMIPLAALLPAWRRIVREASSDAGRPARLVAEIGDVEIDRTILDALRDPLMHLLRNAVGHGLEPARTRKKLGKPETGVVRVRAGLVGGSVRLEIADDGAGIDAEVLRRRAVASGVMSRDEAAGLSTEEAHDLVFQPGFSTAESADQVSGRGVGLDIVRSRIHAFGGSVEIAAHGELGGAAFALVVPASLVSLRGLDVRCGHTTVVLPIDFVERTTRFRAEQLRQVDGGTAVPLGDGEPIRLRQLGRLLGLSAANDVRGWLPVVVVKSGRRRLGLVVDEILGEGDHVTGSLPWCFGAVPGVAGATVLGGGRVAPVIDVAGLFVRREESADVRAAIAGRRPRILVVDDSITSRTLEKNILQAAGYDVTTGVDGVDGWEKLRAGDFDLLVTDIEMPRLDGLGLTRKVRQEDQLKNLPVIVVSSLGSAEDLDSGARAGADEYLVKRQFDQQALLDAVARHVA